MAARKKLNKISEAERRKAREAFSNRDLEAAEKHSSVAILAYENDSESLGIKLALARIKGKSLIEKILWESAGSDATALEPFVEQLCTEYNRRSGVPAACGTSVPKPAAGEHSPGWGGFADHAKSAKSTLWNVAVVRSSLVA